MRIIRLKLLITVFLGTALLELNAQEAVVTAGGNAEGSGGSISYSIGQVIFSTIDNKYGVVSAGVQQPYEIFVVTGTGEIPGVKLYFDVFPNPVSDYLNLRTDNNELGDLSYQLYDINGRLISQNKISSEINRISMGEYKAGTYFLRVKEDNLEITTFKIIKY